MTYHDHYVDEYGGDLSDPTQRCKHGTFIGTWAGPDYLCPACECPHNSFDADGECTDGCGYLANGEPAPRPAAVMCDYAETFTDWDGTRGEYACTETARHSLILAPRGEREVAHFCTTHMTQVIGTINLRDGELWLGEDTRLLDVRVGEVVS